MRLHLLKPSRMDKQTDQDGQPEGKGHGKRPD